MTPMIAVVIALIGLVGSAAVGNALSEWFRRRNLHESIKADLSVWTQLPDGDAKSRLLARIEQRVDGLAVEPTPSLILRFAAAIIPSAAWLALTFGTVILSYGWKFRRDESGILRLYTSSGNDSMPFLVFILMVVIGVFVNAIVLEATGTTARRRIRKLIRDRSNPPVPQTD
ncbi:Uncharacterised protein [Mycolicibacterium phlei]|nr:Uncharacterised protein [Mycolicibacterium phlei]